MLFVNILPSLFIVGRSETLTYNIFFVHDCEHMSSQRGWMVPPGTTRQPLFNERLQMNMDGSKPIFEQDRHVDELVQIGLRSRYATRGRYSWQEQTQSELNKWLVKRYRRYWAEHKSNPNVRAASRPSPLSQAR